MELNDSMNRSDSRGEAPGDVPPADMTPVGPPAAGFGTPPAGGPPAGMPPAGGPPIGGLPADMTPVGPPSGFGAQGPGTDPVTGVLNMAGFGQAFARLSAAAPADDMALWYIDIRTFRSINPKFGYNVGNGVLCALADGIHDLLSHDLPVTRLGGDRFVVVSAGLGYEVALVAFNELTERVNDAVAALGVTSRLTLLGGIYYLHDEDFRAHDFKRALDYASIAHRKAQLDPHSLLVLFTEEDLERDRRRIVIEQSIDAALREGQIEVWYQPQVDYTYGEIVGAEALARWKHPELGWISPIEFIPVLEESGKVHDLDLYVWEEACRSAGRWRSMADGNPVPISVNVSRAEMFEPGLLQHFKELQEKYDLPDGCLHLEVTESAFVEEAERLYKVIEQMRKNDMVVEMDDFGSGLSSLNMLKDVPVDVVKLDMGFVRAGVNEERGGVVLGSIIRMLQGLDTPIIAEGVESLEQAEMLKNMGCHLMQGFHFSHPMPLAEFEDFILSNSAAERTERRERTDSHLEELMSFNKDSSYLFNEAIGGTMFFFTQGEKSESILVNDEFYEECGLDRRAFGNTRVNPIQEIDEQSRQTMWRAAAEALEFGSAMCTAQVRTTGRWIEGCMRYLGESSRGRIFSLNICRSGDMVEREHEIKQAVQDFNLSMGMLDKIADNGFVKCMIDEGLTIDYMSPHIVLDLGLEAEEFDRRFHHSFIDLVVADDRGKLMEALSAARSGERVIDREVRLYRKSGGQMLASLLGRVVQDGDEKRLYLHVILKGEVDGDAARAQGEQLDRTIPFDYFIDEAKAVIRLPLPDGTVRVIVKENWGTNLDDLADFMDAASAAKLLALVRDLRRHPISGFTDLKCNLRGDGELRWYHINYTCETDEEGNARVLHGLAQDANDEIGSTRWWRKQAQFCQLTGLLNRNSVEQKINLLLRQHGGGMMFMIDLDGFKRVNDELGHLVGDDLLREVGRVLSGQFRETDALGRYGGDEFVAFMPLPATGDAAELARSRADGIIAAISRIEIPDGTHAASSVGVVLCEDRDASFYDLLEVADQALYESKDAGKGRSTVKSME